MFSGFWGWFLVVLIVAAIFGAGKLPDLRKEAEEKLKLGFGKRQRRTEQENCRKDQERQCRQENRRG